MRVPKGEKLQERWKRDARSTLGVQVCSLVEKVYGEIERNEEQKRAQVFQGSESATQFSDWMVWPGWDWLCLEPGWALIRRWTIGGSQHW